MAKLGQQIGSRIISSRTSRRLQRARQSPPLPSPQQTQAKRAEEEKEKVDIKIEKINSEIELKEKKIELLRKQRDQQGVRDLKLEIKELKINAFTLNKEKRRIDEGYSASQILSYASQRAADRGSEIAKKQARNKQETTQEIYQRIALKGGIQVNKQETDPSNFTTGFQFAKKTITEDPNGEQIGRIDVFQRFTGRVAVEKQKDLPIVETTRINTSERFPELQPRVIPIIDEIPKDTTKGRQPSTISAASPSLSEATRIARESNDQDLITMSIKERERQAAIAGVTKQNFERRTTREEVAFVLPRLGRLTTDVLTGALAIKKVDAIIKGFRATGIPGQVINRILLNPQSTAPAVVKLVGAVGAGIATVKLRLAGIGAIGKFFEPKLEGLGEEEEFTQQMQRIRKQQIALDFTSPIIATPKLPGQLISTGTALGLVKGGASFILPVLDPNKEFVEQTIRQEGIERGLSKAEIDKRVRKAEIRRRTFEIQQPLAVLDPEAMANLAGKPIKAGEAASSAFVKRIIPGAIEGGSARAGFMQLFGTSDEKQRVGTEKIGIDIPATGDRLFPGRVVIPGTPQTEQIISESQVMGTPIVTTREVDGQTITETETPIQTVREVEITPAVQATSEFRVGKVLDIATFAGLGSLTAGLFGAGESKLRGSKFGKLKGGKVGDISTEILANIPEGGVEFLGDVATPFLQPGSGVGAKTVTFSKVTNAFNFNPSTVVDTTARVKTSTSTRTKTSTRTGTKTTTKTSIKTASRTQSNIINQALSTKVSTRANVPSIRSRSLTASGSTKPSVSFTRQLVKVGQPVKTQALTKTINDVVTRTRSDVSTRTGVNTQALSNAFVNTNVNVNTNTFTNTIARVFTPKLPINLFGGGRRKKGRGRVYKRDIFASIPDFTSKVLNLKPKVVTPKQALKEVKKLQTGFEIRPGIKIMRGIPV